MASDNISVTSCPLCTFARSVGSTLLSGPCVCRCYPRGCALHMTALC